MARPNLQIITDDQIRLAKEMGLPKPTRSQAMRLAVKFGGVPALAALIGRTPSTVNRWLYPKERGGTDGRVPTSAIGDIVAAARREGLFLTDDDLNPRPL